MSEAAEVETNLSSDQAAPDAPPAPAPDLSPAAIIAAAEGLRAVVVCGPATALPAGYALAVVCEGRRYISDEAGVITSTAAELSGYPVGAALYFRTDPLVSFPGGAPILTLGVDVFQNSFAGFTQRESYVNVGPCHPAFAAANLAFQRGATAIDILGLSDGEKERLKPWLDALPTHAVEPAQVAVSTL